MLKKLKDRTAECSVLRQFFSTSADQEALLQGECELRFFLAVPLLIIGSFLISITVDSLGSTGNTIMHMIGVAINLFAVFYIWKKKD